MSQIALPAVFLRGGTSKGLFFHRRDLPAERARWDALFLAALGSPDPHGRQLDGMGGGISSLSKVVVVSPSTRPGVDIDYLFGQVAVDRALVDYRSNCGNLTAAVGPFAVDEGLVRTEDGEAALTLHNCNLDQRIEARFEVAGGRAVVEGDTVLDGVAGQGAPIRLSFLDPGGAVTGRLLPTGRARDVLDVPGVGEIEATLIDASTALVVVRADALGLSGVELPDAIEADPALTDRLEAIRRAGAAAMGIAPETESVPKIGFVAPPADAMTLSGAEVAAEAVDLSARVISMGRPHRALPLTAALALAAAARIPGTVAAEVARPGAGSDSPVRIGHPSGVAEVAVDLAAADPPPPCARHRDPNRTPPDGGPRAHSPLTALPARRTPTRAHAGSGSGPSTNQENMGCGSDLSVSAPWAPMPRRSARPWSRPRSQDWSPRCGGRR